MEDEVRDEATIRAETNFCTAVWGALKSDHNDLRKQAIILQAFRADRATLLRALDEERARVAELVEALIDLNDAIDRMWNDTENRVVSERHALDITHAQRAAATTLAKETP